MTQHDERFTNDGDPTISNRNLIEEGLPDFIDERGEEVDEAKGQGGGKTA
jgi:hypothetical protein